MTAAALAAAAFAALAAVALARWRIPLGIAVRGARCGVWDSPRAGVLEGRELVEIGRGTRRVCYRVSGTEYCVKFYYPREQCIEALKMQKSIQREVRRRRFNRFRNASCEEVYVYRVLRRSMPAAIAARMPEVCECVFRPDWGWGVLETFYSNPDGTAIIPYEDEIRRQTPRMREVIYAKAKALLEEVADAGVLFYEPGNFHVLFRADGSCDLKIVDFEPSSKTAVPIEAVWPWFRRRKLMRKSARYLKHLREAYGISGAAEAE